MENYKKKYRVAKLLGQLAWEATPSGYKTLAKAAVPAYAILKRAAVASAGLQKRRLTFADSSSSNAPEMPSKSTSISRSRSQRRGRTMTRSVRYTPMSVDTPARKSFEKRLRSISLPVVKKRKANTQYGSSNAKSAGFFKKGKRGGTMFDKVGKKGITVCRELGGSTAATVHQSIVVGHTIFERYQASKDVARALTKWIATLVRKDLVEFTQVAWATGETLPALQFTYRKDAGGSNVPYPITVVAGTTTWDGIATAILTMIDDAAQTNNEFIILSFQHTLGGQIRNYDLLKARMTVYCKSTLKIQNRSINTTGADESDAVDNVPLYGKSYEGSGNFMAVKEDSSISGSFFAVAPPASAFNAPTFYSTISAGSLREPPKVSQLFNVQRNGKAHLDPGQLKTSVLTYYKKMGLNRYLQLISKGNIISGSKSCINAGKYRYFILEKMLVGVATSTVNSPKILYEHDHKMALSIYCRPQSVSNTIITLSPA